MYLSVRDMSGQRSCICALAAMSHCGMLQDVELPGKGPDGWPSEPALNMELVEQ